MYSCARAGKTKEITNADQNKMSKNLFCKFSNKKESLR